MLYFARITEPRRTPADRKERRGTEDGCPGGEPNHRHCDFQSHALPTELPGRRGPPRGRAKQSARFIEAGFPPVQNRRWRVRNPLNSSARAATPPSAAKINRPPPPPCGSAA